MGDNRLKLTIGGVFPGARPQKKPPQDVEIFLRRTPSGIVQVWCRDKLTMDEFKLAAFHNDGFAYRHNPRKQSGPFRWYEDGV